MQFTPQQLAGAQKYSATTRIGNWLEDCKLQESNIAEFERKKQQGTLGLTIKQQKLNKCNQIVPLTYSEDGLLRFGDSIILGHPQIQGALACDLWEETSHGSGQYEVSLTKNMRPTARNVFIIQRVSNERLRDMTATQYEADNILHFGEPFHLECNPSLLVDERTQMLENPKYLASAMKTATNVTRLSNRQASSRPPTLLCWQPHTNNYMNRAVCPRQSEEWHALKKSGVWLLSFGTETDFLYARPQTPHNERCADDWWAPIAQLYLGWWGHA